MASPQLENGYVRIANEILEVLARTNLKGSEHALIFAIMRKTYGFNKKKDKISVSQLEEMLGLSRRTVIYNIQNLEAKKILIVKRERSGEKNEVNVIQFNKDYDMWVVQNSAPQVKINRDRAKVSSAKLRGSAKLSDWVVQNSDEKVKSFAPTIDTIQKTVTKDIAGATPPQDISYLISLFEELNPLTSELYGNTTERKAMDFLIKKFGREKMEATLKALPEIVNKKFAPKITKPTELKRDLAKLIMFVNQEKNAPSRGKTIIGLEDLQ